MLRSLVLQLVTVICATAFLAASGPRAWAQPAGTPAKPDAARKPPQVKEADLATADADSKRPWAKGVSPDAQNQALTLFNEGNTLMGESLFAKAVEKYKAALTHWDHPAIHYNLGLGLVNLDNPVDMHAAFTKSMSFGAPPLGEDKFNNAKNYKVLVEKQLAAVEYTVSVAGAKLIFDGKEVLIGPGTWTSLVRSGEHSIAAQAEGYAPTQLNLKLAGGEPSRLELKLFTDRELTREKRKMASWIPYSVLGAGAVITGVGALLHVSARNSLADYDAAITSCAMTDPTGGCSMRTPAVVDLKSGGESKQTLAFATYTVGGLAIAAGIALVLINRPQPYRIDPFADTVSIAPLVGSDLAGLAASGSF